MAGKKKTTNKKTSKKWRGKNKVEGVLREYAFEIFLAVAFLGLVGFIFGLVYDKRVDHGEQKIESKQSTEDIKPEDIKEQYFTEKETVLAPVEEMRPEARDEVVELNRGPAIAIIIDDMGADPVATERLLNLNIPIGIAILPFQKFSKSTALNAARRGATVMLHLPMEPKSSVNNPGEGALTTDLTKRKVLELTKSALENIPGIEGVNNHMGSRFTENNEKMAVVLGEIKSWGLFFVDSKTTPRSVAYKQALDMGLTTASRDVFLDNDREADLIEMNILKLAEVAMINGTAIGIGHPYPETIEALRKTIPKINSLGVEIVPITALLHSNTTN